MTVARDERCALADLLLSVGPDAPTLCEGWTTRDLVVHLVVREYRPDAAVGLFLPPVQRHLDAVTAEVGARPYPDLVRSYRQGPPRWNPVRLLDRLVNLSENFVHHEDVRRGGGSWEPRDLTQGTRDSLWRAVRVAARGFIVPSGPTVRLNRTDSIGGGVGDAGNSVTVGRGAPAVTVTGEAGELLLWLFGRDKACRLTELGPSDRVVRRTI